MARFQSLPPVVVGEPSVRSPLLEVTPTAPEVVKLPESKVTVGVPAPKPPLTYERVPAPFKVTVLPVATDVGVFAARVVVLPEASTMVPETVDVM